MTPIVAALALPVVVTAAVVRGWLPPAKDWTTTLSARTTTRPVTDRIVSMIDQLLIVWTTERPKNSLTSQNPASLTCEKNTEPAPIASTSSETSVVPRSCAIGDMIPAAVMVATVADPVATRMRTATSQASSSTETPLSLTKSATTSAIPVSMRVCLNPPPAPTIKRIPAIGGSALLRTSEMSSLLMPDARPSVKIATRTDSSSATNGSPMKSSTLRPVVPSSSAMSANALPIIRTTGSRTVPRVMPKPGRRSRFSVVASKRSPAGTGTHRSANRAKSGPATTMVGIATRMPSARVRPRSASTTSIAASGPGWGGTNPCMAESPANAGMPREMIDRSARLATRKMTGIRSTRPISKNIGNPMIAPIAAIDHGSMRGLDRPTIVSTIRSAPPESARSLPNIAPRAISTPTPFTVSPTPVLKLPTTSSMLRPAMAPTVSEPRISARNGCSLKNVISTTSTTIPTSAAVMSTPVPATASTGSGAAAVMSVLAIMRCPPQMARRGRRTRPRSRRVWG